MRAPIVELQPQRGRRPHAVDDVHDARKLIQLRRQRLHLAIAVAAFGGGGVGPEAHRVEAQRQRLVANHLHPPVVFPDEDRLDVRRQRAELVKAVSVDVDERDRQTTAVRFVQ